MDNDYILLSIIVAFFALMLGQPAIAAIIFVIVILYQ